MRSESCPSGLAESGFADWLEVPEGDADWSSGEEDVGSSHFQSFSYWAFASLDPCINGGHRLGLIVPDSPIFFFILCFNFAHSAVQWGRERTHVVLSFLYF